MKRRDFLKYLLATPIAAELDVEKLLWIPEKKIFTFNFHPAQLAFYEGIPYHQSNATTETWLGITRSEIPWNWKRSFDAVCFNAEKLSRVLEDQIDAAKRARMDRESKKDV